MKPKGKIRRKAKVKTVKINIPIRKRGGYVIQDWEFDKSRKDKMIMILKYVKPGE